VPAEPPAAGPRLCPVAIETVPVLGLTVSGLAPPVTASPMSAVGVQSMPCGETRW
jgi:hypothetical protein